MMSKRINKLFTLVELLVVIAILSILMSLLQPALRSAIFKTKTTVCASNLKQVGISYLTYADDYADLYPFAERKHQDNPADWYCDLNRWQGYRHWEPRSLKHTDHWDLKETLKPYFGTTKAVIDSFKCPHMKGVHPNYTGSDYAVFPNISTTYQEIGWDPSTNLSPYGNKKGIMRRLGDGWGTKTTFQRMFILASDTAGCETSDLSGHFWGNHGSLNDPGIPSHIGMNYTRIFSTPFMDGNFLIDDGSVHLKDRLIIGKFGVEMTGVKKGFRVPVEFGEK